MTINLRAPSHKTIITRIRRVARDDPGVPEDAQEGILHAVDAIVDGTSVRFYIVEGPLGVTFEGHGPSFGVSVGVYDVLLPFVDSYLAGDHYDFPVDIGLV